MLCYYSCSIPNMKGTTGNVNSILNIAQPLIDRIVKVTRQVHEFHKLEKGRAEEALPCLCRSIMFSHGPVKQYYASVIILSVPVAEANIYNRNPPTMRRERKKNGTVTRLRFERATDKTLKWRIDT